MKDRVVTIRCVEWLLAALDSAETGRRFSRQKNVLTLGILFLFCMPLAHAQPNIIFILADDMSADEVWPMTQLQTRVTQLGTEFTNMFVTTSLCCPSRASILRGQYAHNHGVLSNGNPDGGFNYFYDNGLEADTIAVRLQTMGYRTGGVTRLPLSPDQPQGCY